MTSKKKRNARIVAGILLLALGYALIGAAYYAKQRMQSTVLRSGLTDKQDAVAAHFAKSSAPVDLKLLFGAASDVSDIYVVCDPPEFWPAETDIQSERLQVAVKQKDTRRTALWPFGRKYQWAILSDGSIVDLFYESAIETKSDVSPSPGPQ